VADGVNIDWSLAKPQQNFTDTYANAFAAGRQVAQQQGESAAAAQFGTDPAGGANAMLQFNPALGLQLKANAQAQQDRSSNIAAATAAAGGDYAGAAKAAAGTGDLTGVMSIAQHVATLSETQLKVAQQRAGIIAGVLHSVQESTSDPALRQSILQKMVSNHPEYGITPDKITPDFVSDQAIAGFVGQTMSAQQQIDDELKAREAGETHRHNLAEEGKPQYVETKNPDGSTSQTLVNPDAVRGAQGAPGAAAPAGPAQATPADLDALARMGIGEAQGEGPGGMAAVMHTALNRSKASGQPIASVVTAPGQYQGMSSPRTQLPTTDPHYQAALQIAQGVVGGQVADPTGGATHFLNPDLQAQQGAAMPSWAAGQGVRIGHHVFYGGAGASGQGATGPGGAPAAAAPYQVASTGPTPPPPAAAGAAPPPAAAPSIGGTPTRIDSPGSGQAPGDTTKTGDAYLATLDPTTRAEVNAILDGRMVIPSGAALRSPQIARLVAAAATADPSFDAANAGARAKTRASFAGGPFASQVVSFNTALGHLDQLDRAIDGLHNGAIPFGNNTVNFLKQNLGDASIDKFRTAAIAAATEFSKALQGGQPHEAEIQQWTKQVDEDKSPEQLHATVRQMADLLASKINALGDQYSQGMGVTRDGITLLHPDAAGALARLGGENGAQATARAQFYQHAEASGMPARNIDAAWQQYATGKTFGAPAPSTPGRPAGPPAAPAAPGVRHYNPATGRLE
jgi:spore germination cell wall hydrolase CwlJ-like protein